MCLNVLNCFSYGATGRLCIVECGISWISSLVLLCSGLSTLQCIIIFIHIYLFFKISCIKLMVFNMAYEIEISFLADSC